MKGTMHDDIPHHMHNPFFTTNVYTVSYILFIDDLLNEADGFFQFIPRDIELFLSRIDKYLFRILIAQIRLV